MDILSSSGFFGCRWGFSCDNLVGFFNQSSEVLEFLVSIPDLLGEAGDLSCEKDDEPLDRLERSPLISDLRTWVSFW
jgi:hypothetical protein